MQELPLTKNGLPLHAGFGLRLAAYIIDIIVCTPVAMILFWIQSLSIPVAIAATIVGTLFQCLYRPVFHYCFGATPGKMVLRLKVVKTDGTPINMIQALLRHLVTILFLGVVLYGTVFALSVVDADTYLGAAFLSHHRILRELQPVWCITFAYGLQGWILLNAIVLATTKRHRAIHDFIAGTVVVRRDILKMQDVTELLENMEINRANMDECESQARSTFKQFKELYLHSLKPKDGTAFKISVNHYGEVFHLWYDLTDIDGETLVGTLQPPILPVLKPYESTASNVNDMEDWMILHEGTLYGGFSLRLQRSQLPESMWQSFDQYMRIRNYAELEDGSS